MPRKGEHKYSEEYLAEVAARYSTIKEFKKKDHAVYIDICKRGLHYLLDNIKRLAENKTDEELAEIAACYDDLKIFRKEASAVYTLICKRGLLHLTAHMQRRIDYHTDEELAEITSQYKNLNEFRRDHPNLDTKIRARGLQDELYSHMRKHAVEKVISDEELAEIASRYDNFKEFMAKEKKVYNLISHRRLTEKLCGHMKRLRPYRYSSEELAKIAAGYDVLLDFIEKEPNIYDAILNRGMLDELCGHMKRERVFRYSEEELAEIASRYKTLKEFIKKENSVYYAIKKRGLEKELCEHMKRVGNRYRRKIYVFTFSDNYAYVGLAKDPDERYNEHTRYDKDSPVYKHIEKAGASFEFKILTDWLDIDSAAQTEDNYIKQYKSDGWKMLNKNKGGALGMMTWLYTDDNIRREIGKYEYFEDFKKGSPRFYIYICNHHLCGKYFSQMKRRKRQRIKWTINLAIEAAKKCRNRSELSSKHYQAYDMLKKAGLLDTYLPVQKPFVTSE